MSTKVQLESPPHKPHLRPAPGNVSLPIRLALPYFKSARSEVSHRIRWAEQHWRDGVYSHTSLRFYCQQQNYISPRHSENRMTAAPLTKMCRMCMAQMIIKRLPCPV